MLLGTPGYRCLQSSFVAHWEKEEIANVEEVALAKSRLPQYFHNGDADCKPWRLVTATDLACAECQCDVNARAIKNQPDYTCLLSHQSGVRA